MKRAWLAVIAVWLSVAVPAHAQVIDRMMAVVNNHIVTLSDVSRERLVRQVLGNNSSSDDKVILHDLIDAQIIEDEITQLANIEVSEADVDREFNRIADRRGLPASILHDAIRRRLRAEQFFAIRFRESTRVSDDETRQYYETVFTPEARKRGLEPIPPLDQVSETIQKNITQEKAAKELESWLEVTRQRSDIEIFP